MLIFKSNCNYVMTILKSLLSLCDGSILTWLKYILKNIFKFVIKSLWKYDCAFFIDIYISTDFVTFSKIKKGYFPMHIAVAQNCIK